MFHQGFKMGRDEGHFEEVCLLFSPTDVGFAWKYNHL